MLFAHAAISFQGDTNNSFQKHCIFEMAFAIIYIFPGINNSSYLSNKCKFKYYV